MWMFLFGVDTASFQSFCDIINFFFAVVAVAIFLRSISCLLDLEAAEPDWWLFTRNPDFHYCCNRSGISPSRICPYRDRRIRLVDKERTKSSWVWNVRVERKVAWKTNSVKTLLLHVLGESQCGWRSHSPAPSSTSTWRTGMSGSCHSLDGDVVNVKGYEVELEISCV